MRTKIKFSEIKKQFKKATLYIEDDTVQEISVILDRDWDELEGELYHGLFNYVVIRLVSAIENYFKNRARELIDNDERDVSGIFEKNEIIIYLHELDDIPSGNITKGQIVSYGVNFQKFSEINRVFTKLLELENFENEVRKANTAFVFSPNQEQIIFNLDKILELIDSRHKIVHEMTNFEGDLKELKRYFANCIMLFSISNTIISKKLRKSKPKK